MKKQPKQSKHCSLETDRTSQLPNNVIDKILTSLPIIEAAKTAVLSRNWKRGWKHISLMLFDSSFGKKFERAGSSKLMLAIYRTLFLHLGAIDGFALSIPWLQSCAEINSLIQFLSEKKVKHLKIHIYGDLHLLPSYLFSCSQLITLDLFGCVINPPRSFGGFSQLITLVLKEVHVPNDFFGKFISDCPLLNELFLYSYNVDYEYGKPLIFDTLKKLRLDEFYSAIPALRKLSFDWSFLTILEVRDLSREPNCLQKMEVLHVNSICLFNWDYVSFLIGFISSSPNLERLSAKIHKCKVDPNNVLISRFTILETDRYDFAFNRLETVVLLDFDVTDCEMDFVKFFLSRSPQLKTMTIHQASKDDQKGLQILRKIVRFQRASAVVDINYCDPEVAQVLS